MDRSRHKQGCRGAGGVLMVSASTSSQALAESADAGASGYLLKGGDADALVEAVRNVAGGGTAWPDAPRAATATRQAAEPITGDTNPLEERDDPLAAT